MTEIDLDALEATARAATPGPWHRHPHPLDDQMSDIRGPINDDYDVVVYAESEPSDAEHIAAFDPPTVLALIARLREAEACIAVVEANIGGPKRMADGHMSYIVTEDEPIRAAITRYKTTKTEKEQDQ